MAVSIGELEVVAAKGWRAPQEEWLGGWTCIRSPAGRDWITT
jgi:hypothetical protein